MPVGILPKIAAPSHSSGRFFEADAEGGDYIPQYEADNERANGNNVFPERQWRA
jgi:hypothetical protein